MKHLTQLLQAIRFVGVLVIALTYGLPIEGQEPFGQGYLTVKKVARNAVRIQYTEQVKESGLPDWLYVGHDTVGTSFISCCDTAANGTRDDVSVAVDGARQRVTVMDKDGRAVFKATTHELRPHPVAASMAEGDALTPYEATLAFASEKDEYLFGLGQFQDGYLNVRGLSRRLTQVNTQISIPMLISSKGYGILWNNYGMTEFNPCSDHVALTPQWESTAEGAEVVNVTSTDGGKKEKREHQRFEATITVAEEGDYALLLDVGQAMARRHHLCIDGEVVIDMQNIWLPPTASKIIHLDAGQHSLTAELSRQDKPTLYYKKVEDTTVFHSPVASSVDYTVFVGTPDEIIATYRLLTGACPPMPSWALGYIHCRERFHSSDEILTTAHRFESEHLPVGMLVQDWQYWGKHGWNAMRFDADHYPDPKGMIDSLHRMDIRFMLSVWSKIDKHSEVGRQMEEAGYYIAGTDWIDFFSSAASTAYWNHFRERLVPLGIDGWWLDATEPENDDLVGRRVNGGRWRGEQVRNIYPLMVNKRVYEGLLGERMKEKGGSLAANDYPFILTRCGYAGIQRYGCTLWSGDVGNDWESFRRQIVGGLGLQSSGIPWWTYDAGGFFRPSNQYTDEAYIERMLRWIETSVYLPLMRVHGYMSNTEPWNYGAEALEIISDCLKEREQLRPYLERCAERISQEGYTLMRPLVFDFWDDPEALKQKYEYMFGPSLLVNPVTEPGVSQWSTYLPRSAKGWRDKRTGKHYEGGQTVTTAVDKGHIPVFVRE